MPFAYVLLEFLFCFSCNEIALNSVVSPVDLVVIIHDLQCLGANLEQGLSPGAGPTSYWHHWHLLATRTKENRPLLSSLVILHYLLTNSAFFNLPCGKSSFASSPVSQPPLRDNHQAFNLPCGDHPSCRHLW